MTAPAVDRPAADDPAAAVWALVQRAQSGDMDAFGEIYRHYYPHVEKYIYFRVRSRQISEDLTSETFLRALKRIDSFTWKGRDLGAWLVTIARNLVADYYKSGRYRLEITTGDVLDADREDRNAGPEDSVVEYLSSLDLLGAIKQLNADQQQCIIMRFFNDCSHAEVAQAMGRQGGAIKALQFRAVRSLLRILTADRDNVPAAVLDYFASPEV